MKTKIIAVLAVAVVLLALPFWAKAETRKARLYNYVTEMHVMPIGFAQVPTNVIAESMAGVVPIERTTKKE